jgi:trehalose-6-phosphatase
MLKQNKDVDYQNIPENGFNSKREVNEWWNNKNENTIIKIYKEYYDITEEEELLLKEEI